MLTDAEKLKVMQRRYDRLAQAAEYVVRDARAIGTPESPMCSVAPWRIKLLRRELNNEPQPSALPFATMSVS